MLKWIKSKSFDRNVWGTETNVYKYKIVQHSDKCYELEIIHKQCEVTIFEHAFRFLKSAKTVASLIENG